MIINARGVVSIFAKRRAVLRLVRTVHAEPDDEWQLDRRYFSTEAPAKLGAPQDRQDALTLALVATR